MSQETSVEAYEIKDRTAPHNVNVTVEGNRDISLRWDNPTVGGQQTFSADLTRRPVTTDNDCPEFISSFRGPKSGMAVATDGKWIYTSIYNEDGRIEKYDLQGNKAGSYKLDDIDGIRNMAFDGEWFYIADNTNYIHRVNPATMEDQEDISISEYSRHLAYVPTLDNDNGSLAPANLRVSQTAEGNKLSWMFPALGEPIYLRWHDGYNYNAGGLSNGGAFFAGAKWFASDLKGYGSLALSDVEVYINQIPDALFLLVYENNTLVRQQYVPTMKQYAFNTIHLDEPLKIDESKDLRVAVYVEHNEITVPLGYDHGPARSGRGDLYSSDGVTWTTMEDSGSEVDANWNISIGLSPYSNALPGTSQQAPRRPLRFIPKHTAPAGAKLKTASAKGETASDKNVFYGYNVYRNGERLNADLMTDTTYTDSKKADEKYLSYQVSAVYAIAGEKFSDKVTVAATGVDGISSGNGVKVMVEGNSLVVLGAHTGDRIALYSAEGKQMASLMASDSYRHDIHLTAVTTGVYVVKVGHDTFKLQISRH